MKHKAARPGFWSLAGGFWRGRDKWRAWRLSVGLALLCVANLGIQVALNHWARQFYNAIEQRHGAGILRATLLFAPLSATFVLIAVLFVLYRVRMQIAWREWLTHRLLQRWLTDAVLPRLDRMPHSIQAPEYRVSDDARMATELIVEFAIGLTSATLGAVTFLGILWSVGGQLSLHLGERVIVIPAYMVFVAVLYALLTSGLMNWFGRNLIPAVEIKNQHEAELRFHLTRVRENAEMIAQLGAIQNEKTNLYARLWGTINSWKNVMRHQARAEWIKAGNGILLNIVPILLASPKYISGQISFGALMQLAGAFTAVQLALNWFVENFPKLADCRAAANRVVELARTFEALEQEPMPVALQPVRPDVPAT